jgi:hypothetical protein
MKYKILIKKSDVVLDTIQSVGNKFPGILLTAKLEPIIQGVLGNDAINLEINCLDSGKSTSETSME